MVQRIIVDPISSKLVNFSNFVCSSMLLFRKRSNSQKCTIANTTCDDGFGCQLPRQVILNCLLSWCEMNDESMCVVSATAYRVCVRLRDSNQAFIHLYHSLIFVVVVMMFTSCCCSVGELCDSMPMTSMNDNATMTMMDINNGTRFGFVCVSVNRLNWIRRGRSDDVQCECDLSIQRPMQRRSCWLVCCFVHLSSIVIFDFFVVYCCWSQCRFVFSP